MRLRTGLAGAVLLAAPVAGPASGADGVYPPAGVRVVAGTAEPSRVDAGGLTSFSGDGFAPRSLLRLSVDGVEERSFPADPAGAFRVVVALAEPGQRVLAVTGLEPGGRVRAVSAQVTVRADATTLPTTGRDVSLALGAGLGLVVAGAGAVHLARRRRVAAAAPRGT